MRWLFSTFVGGRTSGLGVVINEKYVEKQRDI
jgi:hypothetical protein